jgi:hypothetical protein
VRLAAGSASVLPHNPAHLLQDHIHINWAHLGVNLTQLREVFWSVRLLEYLAVAGAIAAFRRSAPKAAFLITWFAGYLVVKGSSERATVFSTSFFRLIMPAFPALFLLAAAIPLLLPGVGGRLRRDAVGSPPFLDRHLRPIVATLAAGLAVVPFVFLLIAQPLVAANAVRYPDLNFYVTVSNSFELTARRAPDHTIRLSWKRPVGATPTRVFYQVLRSTSPAVLCLPLPDAAANCTLFTVEGPNHVGPVGQTRGFGWRDRHPLDMPVYYRIAAAANWRDSMRAGGDAFMVSNEAAVTAP